MEKTSQNDSETDEQKKDKTKSEKRKYCVCRKSHVTGFMIQCDFCFEWFHGPCIKVTKQSAAKIEQFLCPLCTSDQNVVPEQSEGMKLEQNDLLSIHDESSNSNLRSMTRANDQVLRDCNDDSFPQISKRLNSDSSIAKLKKSKKNTIQNKDSNLDPDYSDDGDKDSDDEFGQPPKKKIKRQYRRRVPKKQNQNKNSKRGRRKGQSKKTQSQSKRSKRSYRSKLRRQSSLNEKRDKSANISSDNDQESRRNIPRQCYGPSCTKQARRNSKYCSEECGMNLAEKRICAILEERIRTWQMVPTLANNRDFKELGLIEAEIEKHRNIVKELEIEKANIQIRLERIEDLALLSNNESNQNESEAVGSRKEIVAICKICGKELTIKEVRRPNI